MSFESILAGLFLYKLKFYLSGQGWADQGIQLFIMITLPGRTMLPPSKKKSSFIIWGSHPFKEKLNFVREKNTSKGGGSSEVY